MELTLEEHLNNSISLDRLDSSLEYTIDNVVITTKEINLMKRDTDVLRFIELCRMVSKHNV